MELIYKKTADGVTTEGFLRNYEADFDITTGTESPTNDFEIIIKPIVLLLSYET